MDSLQDIRMRSDISYCNAITGKAQIVVGDTMAIASIFAATYLCPEYLAGSQAAPLHVKFIGVVLIGLGGRVGYLLGQWIGESGRKRLGIDMPQCGETLFSW